MRFIRTCCIRLSTKLHSALVVFFRVMDRFGYKLTGLTFNMLFLFLVGVVMMFIRSDRPPYFFGLTPTEIGYLINAELWVMALTNFFLLLIMLFQYPWTRSEASVFRYIGVKAIFWLALASNYQTPQTIRADTLISLGIVAMVLIDLDLNLFGRYILGWEDGDDKDSGKERDSRHEPIIPGIRGHRR